MLNLSSLELLGLNAYKNDENNTFSSGSASGKTSVSMSIIEKLNVPWVRSLSLLLLFYCYFIAHGSYLEWYPNCLNKLSQQTVSVSTHNYRSNSRHDRFLFFAMIPTTKFYLKKTRNWHLKTITTLTIQMLLITICSLKP